MNNNSLRTIAPLGLFGLPIVAYVVPVELSSWVVLLWVLLFIAISTYSLVVDSKKAESDLLKNAVIASIIVGALAMLFYGAPSLDPDAEGPNAEGFPTTFESKAAHGVVVFLKVLAGAFIGIRVAANTRKEQKALAELWNNRDRA